MDLWRGFQGAALAAVLVVGGCDGAPGAGTGAARPGAGGADAEVTTRGTIEVTARLVEIPEGAIFRRELYDYATVLKYEVVQVHRGPVEEKVLYVGHYNPFKPRAEAADQRVPKLGGNLRAFRPGQMHRMALEADMEEQFLGGVVNKYFGQVTGPVRWAVWTNGAE